MMPGVCKKKKKKKKKSLEAFRQVVLCYIIHS